MWHWLLDGGVRSVMVADANSRGWVTRRILNVDRSCTHG